MIPGKRSSRLGSLAVGKEINMTGTVDDAASLADCIWTLSNIPLMLLLEQTHKRFTEQKRIMLLQIQRQAYFSWGQNVQNEST